jgi:hypothetical protein
MDRGAGHLDACLLTLDQKRQRRAAVISPPPAEESA